MPARAPARRRVELENAGAAAWRTRGGEGVQLSYHWLDELGNPIVWDGAPHRRSRATSRRASASSSRSRCARRCRPAATGSRSTSSRRAAAGSRRSATRRSSSTCDVLPRLERRALAVRGADPGALDGLEEPVVPERRPRRSRSSRPASCPRRTGRAAILDAHDEGYGIVGGSVAARAAARAPAARARSRRGAGRRARARPSRSRSSARRSSPALEPSARRSVGACRRSRPPEAREPWLYDGRIGVTARPRSGRRRA